MQNLVLFWKLFSQKMFRILFCVFRWRTTMEQKRVENLSTGTPVSLLRESRKITTASWLTLEPTMWGSGQTWTAIWMRDTSAKTHLVRWKHAIFMTPVDKYLATLRMPSGQENVFSGYPEIPTCRSHVVHNLPAFSQQPAQDSGNCTMVTATHSTLMTQIGRWPLKDANCRSLHPIRRW